MEKKEVGRCGVTGESVVRLGSELISPQIETEFHRVFCYFLLCGTLCYPVVKSSNTTFPYAIVHLPDKPCYLYTTCNLASYFYIFFFIAISFTLLADIVS